jgi:hypothetical protein
MSKYIRYYNNNNPDEWATQNLTPEELAQFQQAEAENNALWQTYTDQGLISVHPIYESVYVPEIGQTVQVQTGEEVRLAPGVVPEDIPMAASWEYWLSMYPDAVVGSVIFES